uniref:Uncharacterized protein n=1 Tax=Micrurus surinamensis TaxID=129470 RepID=A0A2D4NWC7_MICSU
MLLQRSSFTSYLLGLSDTHMHACYGAPEEGELALHQKDTADLSTVSSKAPFFLQSCLANVHPNWKVQREQEAACLHRAPTHLPTKVVPIYLLAEDMLSNC